MEESGYLLSETAAKQLASLFRKGSNPLPQPAKHRATQFRETTPGIRFKNNSGSAVPPYGVMAVTQYDSGYPFLTNITKPDTTFRRRYIVNGPAEIRNGGCGYAQAGPIVHVLYDSGTPALGEGWGPKPGEWTLSKNYPQTALVEGVIDSTNKIMLATWLPIGNGMGEATEDVAAGATGTIAVLQGTLPGTAIPSMTIECVCPMELTNGDTVVWGYYNGQLAAFPWDCGGA